MTLSCAAGAPLVGMMMSDNGSSTSGHGNLANLKGKTIAHASWIRPQSLGELRRTAEYVAYAEVIDIEAGPALVSSSGAEVAPTQRIRFKRINTFRGNVAETFKVFRTGGPNFAILDDPDYQVGERYLLFLRDYGLEAETLSPISPDGRLKEQQGRVRAAIRDGVAETLRDRVVEEAARVVERAK